MRMTRTIPALPVQHIGTAAQFYRDRLGFTVGYQDDGFALLRRDEVELHLWAANDERWQRWLTPTSVIVSGAESFLAGTASCRVEVEGIDELFEEYRASGVLYNTDTVVETQPWGTREFPALDLHRNLLTFYELGR